MELLLFSFFLLRSLLRTTWYVASGQLSFQPVREFWDHLGIHISIRNCSCNFEQSDTTTETDRSKSGVG